MTAMGVSDILTSARVSVASEAEGVVRTKAEAVSRLAALLADGQQQVSAEEINRVLNERERLQSTGVGGGVAIPHGIVDQLGHLHGAVLLCPRAIEFEAYDGAPVGILIAVIGPTRLKGEHLKMLARISRLLRDDRFREQLLAAASGRAAFELIAAEEGRVTHP
jgi:PTS system nitrogen regulatory IIA component